MLCMHRKCVRAPPFTPFPSSFLAFKPFDFAARFRFLTISFRFPISDFRLLILIFPMFDSRISIIDVRCSILDVRFSMLIFDAEFSMFDCRLWSCVCDVMGSCSRVPPILARRQTRRRCSTTCWRTSSLPWAGYILTPSRCGDSMSEH